MGLGVIFQQIEARFEARCSASCKESNAELVETGSN